MPYVEALTTFDQQYGKRLWEALRDSKTFPTQGVLWLLDSESGWRLLVASPRVDKVGRRKAYEELGEITRRIHFTEAPQNWRIELISPRTPLYQALISVFGKSASVEGVRLGNTQFAGIYVEDAYLYEVR